MPQAVGAALVKVVVAVAVQVAVAKIQKAMAKRPVKPLQKIDVEYAGALEPRRKLYGNFRAAGLNVIPAVTSGIDVVNQVAGVTLHKCLALSDGEIQAVDAVWFNNDRIDSSLWAATPNGKVSGGPYANFALVRAYVGVASQPADSVMLAMPGWTSAHRGDGIAYVYCAFFSNNEVYKQGAPDVVAEGRGAKVYDPRLDTSPGAHPTSGTYKAFSTNPALVLADFLTWTSGGNESPSRIVWSEVVTAANICDEVVTVPSPSGNTTQNRYTCSIDVYAPQTLSERDETIKTLVTAMMGACWYSGGAWHMRAGAYTSPVGSIVDNDFLGDSVDIATAPPRSSGEVFNTVRGAFTDQGQNTQPVSLPEVSSALYVAEDGETIYTDAQFKTARTAYEAERNAILLLRQARRKITVAGTTRLRCWKFQIYDVVTVTLSKIGWVSQPARILAMRLNQNFTVEIELQEIASTDFTDPLTTDYLTPGAVAPPVSVDALPGAPRNFAATSTASGIIFTWDPPLGAPAGLLYQLFEYSSSTPFASAAQVGPDTPQTSLVIPRTSTTVSYFWVRAKEPSTGTTGTQSPPTNGLPASAASASGALSAIVYPGSATIFGYSASLTTPTVSVTGAGGTPGYTYTTTAISGGSGITVNNGTTASPSWSATGLAEGDVKSGTYRIRVTDSASATYDVYVAVTITRGYGVIVNDTTINQTGSGTSPAVCNYTVTNAGLIVPSPGTNYQWVNPSATASDYDVRFTINSGTLYSGSAGVWLSMASSQNVQVVRMPAAGAGMTSADLTVEIRDHASGTVLDSGHLVMNATIP